MNLILKRLNVARYICIFLNTFNEYRGSNFSRWSRKKFLHIKGKERILKEASFQELPFDNLIGTRNFSQH